MSSLRTDFKIKIENARVGNTLEALAVTGTVESNVARIKMVPDIQKFQNQLLKALALYKVSL